MELIFKNTGQTTGFSSWLKSFKEIQTSLLIECDLKESCFISKAFTTDHSVVKYGKISFDDAGFELLQIKDNDKTEYVLNTSTKKFHYTWCSSIRTMKAKNRQNFTGTRSQVINKGYQPCKRCNP